jgi:hypothetical protein
MKDVNGNRRRWSFRVRRSAPANLGVAISSCFRL